MLLNHSTWLTVKTSNLRIKSWVCLKFGAYLNAGCILNGSGGQQSGTLARICSLFQPALSHLGLSPHLVATCKSSPLRV